MYVEENSLDKALFYQGDILLNFNFPKVSLDNSIYTITTKKENVMLLSQTCDLQIGREGNDRIILCPLHTESQLRKLYSDTGMPKESINGRINNLLGNKKLGMFHLPKNNQIENSFANFARMTSIEIKSLHKLQPDMRLKDNARHFLVYKLQVFLCRAFNPAEQ